MVNPYLVSIHAPVRGATKLLGVVFIACISFNPRAREGRDTCLVALQICRYRFNPRAREGRDPSLLDSLNTIALFQSTRP